MTNLVEEESTLATSTAPPRKRFVDSLNPTLVNALTVLGFAMPVVSYFWVVHQYGVNVIFGDQWSDVTVIRHSYSHLLDWQSLWTQHTENRMLFPNLVVVALARTTHFNIQVEEYVSALMLVVATGLLIWAHKRRSPSIPWLYYCPVVLLAFSLVQYENILWGFQMAWFLVLVSLASTVVLLDRFTLTWPVVIGAVAAAVVGSFSLLQGLLIWPIGLVLLFYRRRAAPVFVIWIVSALASVAVFFHHFDTSGFSIPSFIPKHPISPVSFFTFAVGDVVGTPADGNGTDHLVMIFGLVVVLVAVVTLVICGIQRDERTGSPIGVALLCFGLLFAVLITNGRSSTGYPVASASRYRTYDLLILIGIYLALLGRRSFPNRGSSTPLLPAVIAARHHPWSVRRGATGSAPATGVALPIARWVLAGIIVLQLALGFPNGLRGARSDHSFQRQAAAFTRNIDRTSDTAVIYYLFIAQSAATTRQQVHTAKRLHLSLFAGSGGRH